MSKAFCVGKPVTFHPIGVLHLFTWCQRTCGFSTLLFYKREIHKSKAFARRRTRVIMFSPWNFNSMSLSIKRGWHYLKSLEPFFILGTWHYKISFLINLTMFTTIRVCFLNLFQSEAVVKLSVSFPNIKLILFPSRAEWRLSPLSSLLTWNPIRTA